MLNDFLNDLLLSKEINNTDPTKELRILNTKGITQLHSNN